MMTLGRLVLFLVGALSLRYLFCESEFERISSTAMERRPVAELTEALLPLRDLCLCRQNNEEVDAFFLLCGYDSFSSVRFNMHGTISQEKKATFNAELSGNDFHVFESSTDHVCPIATRKQHSPMLPSPTMTNLSRVVVQYECCGHDDYENGNDDDNDNDNQWQQTWWRPSSLVESEPHIDQNVLHKTLIASVKPLGECDLLVRVCTILSCATSPAAAEQPHILSDEYESSPSASMSVARQLELREMTKDMFYHAYHMYLQHAFPAVSLEGFSRPKSFYQ
jgi:hypothetical protein